MKNSKAFRLRKWSNITVASGSIELLEVHYKAWTCRTTVSSVWCPECFFSFNLKMLLSDWWSSQILVLKLSVCWFPLIVTVSSASSCGDVSIYKNSFCYSRKSVFPAVKRFGVKRCQLVLLAVECDWNFAARLRVSTNSQAALYQSFVRLRVQQTSSESFHLRLASLQMCTQQWI